METIDKVLSQIIDVVEDALLFLVLGVVASFVHAYRLKAKSKKRFTKGEFVGLTLISSFVVYSTVIICREVLNIESDVQYVIAGTAASFSIHILDLIENAITIFIPEALKSSIDKFFGVKSEDKEQ